MSKLQHAYVEPEDDWPVLRAPEWEADGIQVVHIAERSDGIGLDVWWLER